MLLYTTAKGKLYTGDVLETLRKVKDFENHRGKVNLVFTSPPFPLVKEKAYGNFKGEDYIRWMVEVSKELSSFLTDDGSMVIEIGNAWNSGEPTLSTVPIETLLRIKKETGLHLCQEVICHNPSRLPSPVQWVNIERSRLKDSYTRLWWFSKSVRPKANNVRVLKEYSNKMKEIIEKKKYNAGKRPSGHKINPTSFLKDNGGSISSSFISDVDKFIFENEFNASLIFSNSSTEKKYRDYCLAKNIRVHPARMSPRLVDFFIHFLTDVGDIILDPFAGSNTTGWRSEMNGRNWIGIEKDRSYALASQSRFLP